MLKLNNDILFLIFEELSDIGPSLLSCLLVNKLWCELVIPILWRCPMKYFTNLDGKRRHSLFNTIVLQLPVTSKNLLKDEHIISVKQQNQKPSFDYIRFCKYIHHDLFFPYISLSHSQKILLEQEIYKLIVNKCSIKYLNPTKMNFLIYQFSGANTCFSKLTELSCYRDIESSFLYGLAQICKSIEKIYINHHHDNIGLAKLIEMQNQIKYINIKYTCLKCNGGKAFVQALKKHALSILYLKLDMLKMSDLEESFTYFISKLINLQTLILKGEKFEKHLVVAVYSKLQILSLDEISLSIAIKIIQNTNGNLWKIRIEHPGRDLSDYSREYIQTIYKCCPYIKYVTVFLNNQNLDKLENLLISCQFLEGIYVLLESTFVFNKQIGKFDKKKLLDLLVKLAPVTLYKVYIDILFTKKSLESFVNNWKGRKRKSLHLYELFIKGDYWCQNVELNEVKLHCNRFDFWDVGEIIWIDDIIFNKYYY